MKWVLAAVIRILCHRTPRQSPTLNVPSAECPPGKHRITHDEARAHGVVAPTVTIHWLGTLQAEWDTIPPLVMRAMSEEVRERCMQLNWEREMYAIFLRYWSGAPPPALQIFIKDDVPA